MPVSISGSKHFSVNFQASGITAGAEWAIEFFALLVSAGWTPVDFSDGSSVTTSATAALLADIDNANAWQRFVAPAGAFELVLQRGSTSYQWRGQYDVEGYNADGTATVRPTPSDRGIDFIGNGAAVDTSYAGNTNVANGHRYHMCVDSVAGVAGFYYFHVLQITVGTGAVRRVAAFSPLEPGSYPAEDLAPWASLDARATASLNDNVDWVSVFLKGNANGGTEALHDTLRPDGTSTYPGGGVTNPYNSGHDYVRAILEDRSGGDRVQKGSLVDVFLPASAQGALGSTDTLNLATAWTSDPGGDPGALFRYDDVLFPWPHGVTPVI